MSAGRGKDGSEADRLIEHSEATIESTRLILKIERTLTSIERLGDHLFDDINRRAYGAEGRHRTARATAIAVQDAIRALAGRAKCETARLKEEHAASRGVPDLPSGLDSNCTWSGPGDEPDS